MVQSASTCGSGSVDVAGLLAILVTRVSFDFTGTGGGDVRRCEGLGFIAKSGTSSCWLASAPAFDDSITLSSAIESDFGDFGGLTV